MQPMSLILTYSEQLKMLASEEKVDLLDAVKHAGIPTSTYYRSIEGPLSLRRQTAEAIANAIKDLSAR
jgi:predicted transcriptional regulator